MKMMVLRIGIILTLILIVALPYSVHGDQLSIDDCNESQLETILTRAQNGDRISFNCSGLILITRPKIIDRNILLDGTAQQVTLSGNDAQQVFVVNANASLTLSTLTIIGGQSNGLGGGIFNRGTLIVARTTFKQNKHGIINFGTLTVSESSFIDNQGDGIYNSGTLTVKRSTFVRNKHGIDNASGEVEIINSTFVANQAPPGQIGGAIANAGVLTIVGSTFADNVASGGGGAIANRFHSKASIQNTIIFTSNNDPNCFGTTFDEGYNVQYPGTTCGPTIPVADPKLLPLADNGGSTETTGLQVGSPAIGSGDALLCQSKQDNVDQRGIVRIAGNDKTCDIGAFEFNATFIEPTAAATESP